MEYIVIPATKFEEWLFSFLDDFEIFLPVLEENQPHFRRVKKEDFERPSKKLTLALEKIRPAESIKGFFFPPRELVAKGFEEGLEKEKTKRLLIGAKNCDLMPLKVHQKMFLNGKYVDPFYQERLDRTTIISADCPIPAITCFCNLLGLLPYPTTGSDVNITVLKDCYLLESFTDKGRELIQARPNLVRPAREEEIEKRNEQRKKACQILETINPKPWSEDLATKIASIRKDEFWQQQAKTCIECFGCLMVCPTCFCYLLYDQAKSENDFERTKIWDGCYYPAYARVGGGINPRAEFIQRFKNRFHCKFLNCFFDFNFYACSGCGRCFSVCSGEIDIRKVLQAADESQIPKRK